MKPSPKSGAILFLGCLLAVILLVFGRRARVSTAEAKPPGEKVLAPAGAGTGASAQARSEERTDDFTGIRHFAALKAAIQKKDQAGIELALQKLASHLEEHPENLPGLMTALQAEKSPEMNSCVARLAEISR